jgi:hypothetical protein
LFASTLTANQDTLDARFSRCALPYLASIPLVIIVLIAASHVLRRASFLKKWQPTWLKPFVQVSPEESGDLKVDGTGAIWTILLVMFSVLAVICQAVKLKFPEAQLQSVLLLVSWILASGFIASSRPTTSPSSLLVFYSAALVADLVTIETWNYPPALHDGCHHATAVLILASMALVLSMPMTTTPLKSEPISKVGSVPKNTDRSPEDGLSLWEFLTVSWVNALLTVGNQRQLEKEDVWRLGIEFQHKRVIQAFSDLKGSVTRRLLKANGLDCLILTVAAFVGLACGMSNPEIQWSNGCAKTFRTCISTAFTQSSNGYGITGSQ